MLSGYVVRPPVPESVKIVTSRRAAARVAIRIPSLALDRIENDLKLGIAALDRLIMNRALTTDDIPGQIVMTC